MMDRHITSWRQQNTRQVHRNWPTIMLRKMIGKFLEFIDSTSENIQFQETRTFSSSTAIAGEFIIKVRISAQSLNATGRKL